jgi:hypothetical protein
MEGGLLVEIVHGLLDLDPAFADAVLERFDVPQVQGDVDLEGCAGLLRVPASIQVVLGGAGLSGCGDLAELGPQLMVVGDLSLARCRALARLPGTLKVLGRLDLSGCETLRELPRDLTVRGGSGRPGPELDLAGCRSWDRVVPSRTGPFLKVRFPGGAEVHVWRLLLDRAFSSLWVLGGLLAAGGIGLCLAPWAGVSGSRIAMRIALLLGYGYVFLQAVRRKRRQG